jgi:hypothetical protein
LVSGPLPPINGARLDWRVGLRVDITFLLGTEPEIGATGTTRA